STEEGETAEAKPQRPDNGTYLSMYFRDMALLDVLRPEEEFTAAKEIEALEIMLWEAVLSHAPAVERVLDAVVAAQAPAESHEDGEVVAVKVSAPSAELREIG